MVTLPPLSALRSFEAAARHQNFTRAGQELNVTHSAVSQQVRRLESFVGCQLIVRHGKRLDLTDQGKKLATDLSKAFALMQRAVQSIENQSQSLPVAINMTGMFSTEWLAPRLNEFKKAFPSIELIINTRFGAVDLIAGDIEHGIKYGRGDWPNLVSDLLVASPYVIVASPRLLEGKKIKTRNDLTGFHWVQEFDTREVQEWMFRHRLPDREKVLVDYLPGNMILPAARRGAGVAATVRLFVEQDIQDGSLVLLFEEGTDDDGLGYHFVSRTPVRPANVEKFVRWIKSTMSGHSSRQVPRRVGS